jgi:hypothetical protein
LTETRPTFGQNAGNRENERQRKIFALDECKVSKPWKICSVIWTMNDDLQTNGAFQFEKDPQSGGMICVFRNVDSHEECLKNP